MSAARRAVPGAATTPHTHGLEPAEARAYAYLRQLRADYGQVSPDPKVDAYIATLLGAVQRLTTPRE